jgi:EamA-like transporter family.
MNEKNNRVVSRLIAVVTIIIWSITFVSTKILLRYFSPVDLLLIRVVLALLFSEIISFGIHPFMGWKTELWCLVTGFSGVGVYQLAENYALAFADASQVSVIVSIAPLLTVIIATFMGRIKRPSLSFLIGFVIAITGISLVSFKDGVGESSIQGVLCALLSATCWAVYSFAFEKVSKLGVPDRTITKRMFFYSLLLLIPFSLADGVSIDFAAFKKAEVLLNLAFLAFIAQATAFLLWNRALKGLGPIEANIYIYLIPSITAIFSLFILSEPFTAASVFGTVLVLTGLCFSDSSISARIHKILMGKTALK